ncbi:MAG: PH domain-containing protein [Cryobacterium sp.]
MTISTGTGIGTALPADEPPVERIVARLRPHGRVLAVPTVLLIGICAATSYFLGSMPEPWQNMLVAAGAGVSIFFLCLLPFVTWLKRRYTITTRRIIFRHGVFVSTRQELLHSRGYEVAVRRSWLQSLFGTGDVRINSGQEHPLVLKDVPNAYLVQQVLIDLSEASHALLGSRRLEQSTLANQTVPWAR